MLSLYRRVVDVLRVKENVRIEVCLKVEDEFVKVYMFKFMINLMSVIFVM